jgi:uncharacterized membrane protein
MISIILIIIFCINIIFSITTKNFNSLCGWLCAIIWLIAFINK